MASPELGEEPIDPETAPAPASAEEVAALRDFLASMALPAPAPASPPAPTVPFEPLPELGPEVRRALEALALEANETYLASFIEAHSFCPFAAGGRARGLTARFVHVAERKDVEPFLDLMDRAAAAPEKAVVQVIVPAVEVSAADWTRFCHEVTAAGNARLRARGDASVYVVAPLHPDLPYSTRSPFALVPLLRRAPDPTIQWVRLDALDALYAGRSSDTVFVDPADVARFLRAKHRPPLLERIAETNLKMAERLGVPEVERALREIARRARARYGRALLGEAVHREDAGAQACPHHRHHEATIETRLATAVPALREERGAWGLCRVAELARDEPRLVVARGVELVVTRTGDAVHVLHGRCPHRHAPLSHAVVEAGRLVCPHHGWDFRLDTGESEGVLGARVAAFASEVREGVVWVSDAALEAWEQGHVPSFRDDDELV